MTDKTKGHSGWHQMTPNTQLHTTNTTCTVLHIKEYIARLALWEFSSEGMGECINQMEGHDE